MSASVLRVGPTDSKAVTADLRNMDNHVKRGDWLTKGDKGTDVEGLQRALKQRGFYTGPVDGDFGPVTQSAVQAYQRANRLVADGQVGPSTLANLKKNTLQIADRFDTTPAREGQAGKDILGMERRLSQLGYDTGAVDGVFDAATKGAVASFRARDAQLKDNLRTMTRRFEREINKADAPKAPPGMPTSAPPEDYRRINYRGVTVNVRTKVMLERAEAEMARMGHPGFKFSLAQGSYNAGGVAASAGTHDGGGAVDVRDAGLPRKTVDDMVVALRKAGFAAWSRGRGHDSFDPHIHAIAVGDRELSSGARNQVREYFAGGDGLVGSAADPDRGLGRPIPGWARRFG